MENVFKELIGKRGLNREIALNRCANRFYLWLKNNGYTRFNKTLLNGFLPSEMNLRTQQRTIKALFEILKAQNKIRDVKHDKNGLIFYRVKPLFCCDSGSYSIMMSKNGYSVAYFKYDGLKRVKIGNLPINVRPQFNFDLAIKQTLRPIENQSVYTNSPLSVAKCRNKYKIGVLEVL